MSWDPGHVTPWQAEDCGRLPGSGSLLAAPKAGAIFRYEWGHLAPQVSCEQHAKKIMAGTQSMGSPTLCWSHWARERECMAPLLHGTSGAGQPRALGYSHPGAESIVEWCGVKWVIHHGAGSGPGCFPKEGAMWQVPGVPHTGCLIAPGFSPSPPCSHHGYQSPQVPTAP